MTVSNWTEADSDRAREIWSDYQQHHDLSEKAGQTAGIDPASGRIWFGDSIQEVIAQQDADGSEAPLFFVRVGSATYYRKFCYRCSCSDGGHPEALTVTYSLVTRDAGCQRLTS